MEFGLLAAALIAAACLRAALALRPAGAMPPATTRRLWDVALLSVLGGVAVGRVAAMIGGGTNPLSHPLDVLIIRGGVDTVLATAGALVTFAVVWRSDLPAMAGATAPAALAGLAGWHAGCFTRGACLGTPSGLPWAVDGPGGIGRHPVEVYAAVLLAAAFLALMLLWRRIAPGAIAGLALAAAAGSRLATEPMRLAIGGGLDWWYAAGTVIGLLAASVVWRRGRA